MYIAVVSFVIWGFFNFYMTLFKGEIEPLNVITALFFFAFIFMLAYKFFTKETLVLNFHEKLINIGAGASQSLVYILYFYLLFLYPSEAILIVVFYNLFGLILVLLDALVFKTKNDKVEYTILFFVVILSLFLVYKTQLLLGVSLENISFISLSGFLPAFFAALVGILYKYLSDYKCENLTELFHSNFQLLFYRSLGGCFIACFSYFIFLFFHDWSFTISYLEVKLGFLYALFPFLLSHLLYSISLYKRASIVVLAVLMNISPIITILSIYYFSKIRYEIDSISIFIIISILSLSSVLSIYHGRKKAI